MPTQNRTDRKSQLLSLDQRIVAGGKGGEGRTDGGERQAYTVQVQAIITPTDSSSR